MNRVIRDKYRLSIFLIVISITSAMLMCFVLHSLYSSINSIKKPQTINKARLLTNGIMEEINKSYPKYNTSTFVNKVRKRQNYSLIKFMVISTDNKILFKHKMQDSNSIMNLSYDEEFSKNNGGFIRVSFPVILNEIQKANVIFDIPERYLQDKVSLPYIGAMLAPLIILLIFLLILVIVLSIKIHRSIYLPLKELTNCAHAISKGDYNTPVSYRSFTQLGLLCQIVDDMREKLKESINDQAKTERQQKDLIAKISHDIRTPLSSIDAYAGALIDGLGKDHKTQEKYIQVIKSKTESLTHLVNDLFEHSIMDMDKLDINPSECYSRELFNNMLEPLILQFKYDSITLTIEGEIPDVILNVDRLRIEQVLINLIENARKYSRNRGKIIFNAQIRGRFMYITIKDNGIGIEQSEKERIFQSFYRGENVKNKVGSGLGLSICKYIVEGHGGKIFVETEEKIGSAFMFTLPLN